MARWTTRNACGISCNDTSTPLREEISARQRLLAELDRTLATLAHWRIRNMHARIVERPAFSVVGMEYFGSAPATPSASSGNASSRASTRSPASTIPRSPMASARSSPTANSTTSPASRCRRAGRCRRAWCASRCRRRSTRCSPTRARRRRSPRASRRSTATCSPNAAWSPGGVDFEYYDQRFRGPLDPNSQVDLYIPIY